MPSRTRRCPMARPVSTTMATVSLAVALAGCSSSDGSADQQSADDVAATPALGSASTGDLSITGGYVPEPPSPDVASAYFTITNASAAADTLTAVTSDAAPTVMPMTETTSGTTGRMADLTEVTVPAHGSMSFTPTHAHLMLEQPRPLTAGDHVSLTLTFSQAGTVQVSLPVLPFTGQPDDTSEDGAGDMDDMPGM